MPDATTNTASARLAGGASRASAFWSKAIANAELPALFTARDGQFLRLVPASQRMLVLAPQLEAVLSAKPLVHAEAQELSKMPKAARNRAALSWMRGWAYLQAGNADQALLDGRSAIAHAPRGQNGQCTWAGAHALCAAALEAAEDWTQAALHMQQAAELDPENYEEAARQLAKQLPEAQAAALLAGGSAGLRERLEWEREEAVPEVMRRRPKYHYYNAWMTKRIECHFPELPPPVIAKLLALDAGDLDLMLQHPVALQGQVQELLGLLEAGGPPTLAAHTPAPLSWQEVQTLTSPGTVGLPLGYKAQPQLASHAAPKQALPSAQQQLCIAEQAKDAASAAAKQALQAVQQECLDSPGRTGDVEGCSAPCAMQKPPTGGVDRAGDPVTVLAVDRQQQPPALLGPEAFGAAGAWRTRREFIVSHAVECSAGGRP